MWECKKIQFRKNELFDCVQGGVSRHNIHVDHDDDGKYEAKSSDMCVHTIFHLLSIQPHPAALQPDIILCMCDGWEL